MSGREQPEQRTRNQKSHAKPSLEHLVSERPHECLRVAVYRVGLSVRRSEVGVSATLQLVSHANSEHRGAAWRLEVLLLSYVLCRLRLTTTPFLRLFTLETIVSSMLTTTESTFGPM